MAVTPGVINLAYNTGYSSSNWPNGTTATPSTLGNVLNVPVPAVILPGATTPGTGAPPLALISGQGKGAFFNNTAPAPPWNSGDWYSDVKSGAVLVSDGAAWYNAGSGAGAVIE